MAVEASHIDRRKIQEAVVALKNRPAGPRGADGDAAKNNLFPDQDEESLFQLQFVLKKVYHFIGIKIIECLLPHPYQSRETTSICLFVKDLDKIKYDPEVDKSAKIFREYLEEEKKVGNLAEIIALRQLKREYKTFEAKRKLSSAFDLFLVDDRIQPHVCRNLGKSFHARKKLPIPLKVTKGDVARRIEKCLKVSTMVLRRFSTSACIRFGSREQSAAELVENAAAAIDQVTRKLPGGPSNVRSIYLSLGAKVKLPIFISLGSANEVKLPPPPKKKLEPVTGELMTLSKSSGATQVKVFPDGRVTLLRADGTKLKEQGERKRKEPGGRRARSSPRSPKQPKVKTEKGAGKTARAKTEPGTANPEPGKRGPKIVPKEEVKVEDEAEEGERQVVTDKRRKSARKATEVITSATAARAQKANGARAGLKAKKARQVGSAKAGKRVKKEQSVDLSGC